MESFLLSHNPKFLHLLDESSRQAREKGGIPLSTLLDELKRSSSPKRKKSKRSR
jgi:hypothetical protein